MIGSLLGLKNAKIYVVTTGNFVGQHDIYLIAIHCYTSST